jgi:N-acetyl-anhydromuramyl-L-alanine amidase AmpD
VLFSKSSVIKRNPLLNKPQDKKMKKLIIFILTAALFSCASDKYVNEKQNEEKRISWSDLYYKTAKCAKGWKFIVIHHSATYHGNAEAFHNYHTKMGYGGLAYHFVICNGRGGRDGEIQPGFRWKQQISGTHVTVDAWYHNIFGIGICLVGNFQKTKPTKKQLSSLIRLIKKLAGKYKISRNKVMGHGQVPHGKLAIRKDKLFVDYNGEKERRVCPGIYFPMNYVKRMVFKR